MTLKKSNRGILGPEGSFQSEKKQRCDARVSGRPASIFHAYDLTTESR